MKILNYTNNKTLLLLISLIISLVSVPAAGKSKINQNVDDGIVVAGDYLQLVLPGLGYANALLRKDYEGAKQLTYSILTTSAVIHSLKFVVNRNRPNQSNWKSFPSGHTSAAFSGASFLNSRYGPYWGVPAYAAAAFVGASRVHGKHHFLGDVIAGGSVAFMVNQLFVTSNSPILIGPTIRPSNKELGINFSINTNNDKNYSHPQQLNNQVALYIGGYNADDKIDNLQPYVRINYSRKIGARERFMVFLTSQDYRRFFTLKSNRQVGDILYPKGQVLLSNYQHIMFGGEYLYKLLDKESWSFNLGAGINYHHLVIETDIEVLSNKYFRKIDRILAPTFSLTSSVYLSKHIYSDLYATYDLMKNHQYMTAGTGINYKLNQVWQVGLNYIFQYEKFDQQFFDIHRQANAFFINIKNQF